MSGSTNCSFSETFVCYLIKKLRYHYFAIIYLNVYIFVFCIIVRPKQLHTGFNKDYLSIYREQLTANLNDRNYD